MVLKPFRQQVLAPALCVRSDAKQGPMLCEPQLPCKYPEGSLSKVKLTLLRTCLKELPSDRKLEHPSPFRFYEKMGLRRRLLRWPVVVVLTRQPRLCMYSPKGFVEDRMLPGSCFKLTLRGRAEWLEQFWALMCRTKTAINTPKQEPNTYQTSDYQPERRARLHSRLKQLQSYEYQQGQHSPQKLK